MTKRFTMSVLKKTLLLVILLLVSVSSYADLVKPALIEITVNEQGQVDVNIRASIEALLTGINGRYKNTKDAPNADEYDKLRHMDPKQLAHEFQKFQKTFLNKIAIIDNNHHKLSLSIKHIEIPERGYPKVPRISVIDLVGKVDLNAESIQSYYPMAFGDNAVRLKQVNLKKQQFHWSQWQWIRDDKYSTPFSMTEIVAHKPFYKTVVNYIELGFKHILPKGMDHILFILGLFLFSSAIRPLLWQITMFTIAHTITLGLAMNGLFNLPAQIVQPLIALSIVYVGVENVFARGLQKSRLVLVFAFGLLHGLGFASMLADFGMPEYAFATALISFNVGVELGQLSILFIAYVLIGLWFGRRLWYRTLVINPASIVIAIIAFYWFIDRLDVTQIY